MSRRMIMGCVNGLSADANTVLLMHMDGANGETTFQDYSASSHAITARGDAHKTTSNKKFGTAAATFDGTGDYLNAPSSADFSPGTGDFTIDMWIYVNAWTDETVLILINATSGMQFGREKKTNNWGIAAAGLAWKVRATKLPTTGTWHHVAVTRASGTSRIFLDGTKVAEGADSTNYAQGACEICTRLNGLVDELRISKGVARWTANFTPPTKQYFI